MNEVKTCKLTIELELGALELLEELASSGCRVLEQCNSLRCCEQTLRFGWSTTAYRALRNFFRTSKVESAGRMGGCSRSDSNRRPKDEFRFPGVYGARYAIPEVSFEPRAHSPFTRTARASSGVAAGEDDPVRMRYF